MHAMLATVDGRQLQGCRGCLMSGQERYVSMVTKLLKRQVEAWAE